MLRETDLVLDKERKYILKVRDLAQDERPREKLMKYGVSALSVGELMAIVLGVGTRKEEVLRMSNRLLKEYGEKTVVDQTDPKKIQEALGIPIAKSCQIVACFELGRRFFKTTNGKPVFIRTAKQVFEYLKDMRELPKEHLRGMYLNSHYHLVHDEVISIGSLTANIIHPREVFKPALEHSASAVILAHNHPSGIATPSDADIEITKQLVGAGKILGVHLLDHIVVTKNKFTSIPVDYE
ncbi:MAG: DNA repair protein RadC [Candidatus Liptonbacteria bacterium]|nr:DNA repair protein RadC [Candidatus Liptonbacteria bacterium]